MAKLFFVQSVTDKWINIMAFVIKKVTAGSES